MPEKTRMRAPRAAGVNSLPADVSSPTRNVILHYLALEEPSGRRGVSVHLFGCIVALLAAIMVLGVESADARVVRIGVYDNPPKIEMGPGGTPRGIFIDIIEYIAGREAWDVRYVFGTWEEGLMRLEEGSIDLMPDVAFSDVRSQRFAFNQLSVLSSWLQVFSRRGTAIESVADLEGKSVAVLEGSIQQKACGEVRQRFGLTFETVALPDYESTIRHVEAGKADAVIVSQFYGYGTKKSISLVATPVILYPTALHFAAPRGRNQDLLNAIDKHLAQIRNDSHSVYYRSLAYWLQEKPRVFIPRFVPWAIALILCALLSFLILSLVLRWQVRKRTEELSEKNIALQLAMTELKQAQDEALKRERLYAFGQLACGAAHDFNNLLVPIVGYVDQMLRSPAALEDREAIRQRLEVIRTVASHGTEIVRRMQEFHRSTESSELKSTIDTNAIIREVVELGTQRFRAPATAGSPPIQTVLKLGSECEITGRRADIHEMLLNLVLNAADAMPEGGRLEIFTENTGSAVRITVSDTGVGMPRDVVEKCQQPFFTTKGAQGTGMGLTMVSNIVADHGGHLEIESEVHRGTRFTITFPRKA